MKSMTAMRLSALLFVILGLLIIALIGGSTFVAVRLIGRSTVANHAEIDASVSANDPQRLEALKQYLASNATAVSQTAALTAGLGKYDQSRIVAAINSYAKNAGVTISGFDFSGTASNGGTPLTAPSGAANGTFNVTLGSPVAYSHFIVFLRLLENGLMPATVTSGTVTSSSDTPGNVVVSPLTVKVTG
jgi:hypothetical protein